MLDLELLKRLHIRSTRPRSHRATFKLLSLDYRTPPRTRVIVEGIENLPSERPVFIAMNHTDRFSYGPFMWWMHKQGGHRYLATWVKGKYFSNKVMAWWIARTGNIPIPSRGYLITVTFQKRMGRKPTNDEYRILRDLLDMKVTAVDVDLTPDMERYLGSWTGGFVDDMDALFAEMMAEVMRLHREAFDVARRHIMVFPEGTRSSRLTKGRNGLVQVAQHLGLPIVPIGCNGGEALYPGDAPISKGGTVTFRVGKPLEINGPEFGSHRIRADYVPFSRKAAETHGKAFATITDILMDHLSALLDPEFRADPNDVADQGAGRFV